MNLLCTHGWQHGKLAMPEIDALTAENELNLAANRGLGRLVDELQAENERLRKLLKECKVHIIRWWEHEGDRPNSAPPAKSYELVDRIDVALAAAPTPAQEVAGFKLHYKDGSTAFIDRAPDSFELRECMIEPVTLATTPEQEDEPIGYVSQASLDLIAEAKFQIDIDVWKQRDHVSPHPIYTRPDNSGLRKAAEFAANRLEAYEDKYAADMLRAALEGK